MIIQKPIEYKIVKGKSTDELEIIVTALLGAGWVPHGECRCLEKEGVFTQSMTKLGFIEVTMNQGGGLLVPR